MTDLTCLSRIGKGKKSYQNLFDFFIHSEQHQASSHSSVLWNLSSMFSFFLKGDRTHMLSCLEECAQVGPKIALESFALRWCDAHESYSCEFLEPQRIFNKHILNSSNLTVLTQFLAC